MAEPTFVSIFGENATQDSTTVTLTKADFAAVGLTSGATLRGEQLLVAIIKQAAATLTPAAQAANPDQQITVEQGVTGTVFRNGNTYLQYPYTFNLQKVEPTDTVDPDDF